MILRSDTIFVNEKGDPLPEWLQNGLRSQISRLARHFPRLTDPAVLQDILDETGQLIAAQVARGVAIRNCHGLIKVVAYRTAGKRLRGPDIFDRAYHQADTLTLAACVWRRPAWWVLPKGCLDPTEEVLVLGHLIAGCKHRELAAVLKISEANARQKYVRALVKLRAAICPGPSAYT
jgi:hypothetical protein